MTTANFNPATTGRPTNTTRAASTSKSILRQDPEPVPSAEHDELDRATNCIRLRDQQTEPPCDDATDAGS